MPVVTLVLACASLLRAQDPVALSRFDHPPEVDGALDDPAWETAPRFEAFRTLRPEPGREPSEATVVRLGHDQATLYVAVQSLDRVADGIRSEAADAESAWRDDWTAFCLDPQHQGLDAYYFLVTPAGFRAAGTLGADGRPTQPVDLAWSSAARRTPEGYMVEMAIPLAQLPYRSGDTVTMAFKVARSISRLQEEADFPAIHPDRPHISQFQPILLAGIAPSRASRDRSLIDPAAAFREKTRRLARYGDATMEGRVAAWGDVSVFDYRIFPSRPLHVGEHPHHFPRKLDDDGVAARFADLEYLPGHPIDDLDAFLSRTLTTSLIVIHNDDVIYERYFNGWDTGSTFTSFSVAKAFVATLVGIAIDRLLIGAVSDPITRYLPEFVQRDGRFARITVRDLLRMASGLRYADGVEPYDERWTYLAPDLRRSAIDRSTIVEPPSTRWRYNNYNPLLIGLILERVGGRPVTDLLQEWIWGPIGMEHPGSWSLDSLEHGFEKMESGINAHPMDFARLGELHLHDGTWNGRRIVSPAWVHDATQPWPAPPDYYPDEGFFGSGGHYFGYFWWGDRRPDGRSDFHTVGNKGQYIWCSPRKHMVIVRTGMEYGIPSGAWLRLFRGFSDRYPDRPTGPDADPPAAGPVAVDARG